MGHEAVQWQETSSTACQSITWAKRTYLVALLLLVHVDAAVEVILVIRIQVVRAEARLFHDVGRQSLIHVRGTLHAQ